MWNSLVDSSHEAMQETRQDNESQCFALPQALLKNKWGIKGSQETKHFAVMSAVS